MPWRGTRAPYRILVSEIMLQQTPVGRVTAKYAEFLRAFPTVRALAAASVREVMAAWNGLGYNRRALALKEIAGIVVSEHHGRLPRTLEELLALPGIGRATACAILVYAFNRPVAFIETNIRRVFLHFFFPGRKNVADARIMPLAQKTLDASNPREWHYALTDYGAMFGKGGQNPNRRSAHYQRQPSFEGSVRQLRGRVLAAMVELGSATVTQIVRRIGEMARRSPATVHRGVPAPPRPFATSRGADTRLADVLEQLAAEGFLVRRGARYCVR